MTTHPLLADAFVSAQIDRALSAYAGALDADELAWLRQRLAEQIVEDPSLLALLDAAYPREADASGERRKAWLADDDAEERAG